MFKYCPNCSSKEIRFKDDRYFFCPDCNFTYYHNTAAACGLIISSGSGIFVLVRAKDPGKGKLDFPGGFVDPGEGIAEALRRECREELSWDPGVGVQLLASFGNRYPYKNIVYNTCDVFFTIDVPGLSVKDFVLDRENSAVRFVDPDTLAPEDFAFASTRKAFLAFREKQARIKTDK